MNKRTLSSLLIICLLLSTIPINTCGKSFDFYVVEKSSMPNFYGNIFYVGGSGFGNYTKIQDAIDNSSNGDTIFVYDVSSPYYENIVANKSINLIGEDKNTTTIDGKNLSFVVKISEDYVKISGFTIQNSKEVGIELLSSNNEIIGNIIRNCGKDNGRGIFANPPAEYNTIAENIFIDNNLGLSIWGITSALSNYTIINNILLNCYTTGIVLGGTEDCIVSGNTITNHNIVNDDRCSGIYITFLCVGNIISANNIVSPANECKGIMIDEDCYQNSIYDNIIMDHMWGMWLGRGFYDNQIYKNQVENNTKGLYITPSLWGDVSGNNFSENTIKNNYYGIMLESSLYNIKENTISNNIIEDNTYGIYCLTFDTGPANQIFNNNITRNNLLNNDYGLYSKKKYFINNDINQNNFINNRKSNAYCKGINFWDNDGKGNYWDDYIGLLFPRFFDINQDGIGNIPYRRINPFISNFLSGNKDKNPLMKPFVEENN